MSYREKNNWSQCLRSILQNSFFQCFFIEILLQTRFFSVYSSYWIVQAIRCDLVLRIPRLLLRLFLYFFIIYQSCSLIENVLTKCMIFFSREYSNDSFWRYRFDLWHNNPTFFDSYILSIFYMDTMIFMFIIVLSGKWSNENESIFYSCMQDQTGSFKRTVFWNFTPNIYSFIIPPYFSHIYWYVTPVCKFYLFRLCVSLIK